LFDVVETNDAVHVILEHIDGVELFDFLTKSPGGRVQEVVVQHIMYQVLSTLEFMHTRNVMHRDIKLDNILINPATLQIKLIDFNLSTFFLPSQSKFTMPVGCIHYSSPAILEACKTQEATYGDDFGHCDVWASGVAAFGLLQSYFPFKQTKPERLLGEIRSSRGKLLFPHRVSATCQHFLSTILDPTARPTAAQMLRHPWILPCTLKALGGCGDAVNRAWQASQEALQVGLFSGALQMARLPGIDTMLQEQLTNLENYSRARLLARRMVQERSLLQPSLKRARTESGCSAVTITNAMNPSSGSSVASGRTTFERGLSALGMS